MDGGCCCREYDPTSESPRVRRLSRVPEGPDRLSQRHQAAVLVSLLLARRWVLFAELSQAGRRGTAQPVAEVDREVRQGARPRSRRARDLRDLGAPRASADRRRAQSLLSPAPQAGFVGGRHPPRRSAVPRLLALVRAPDPRDAPAARLPGGSGLDRTPPP